ncbi:hypothetical protein DSM104299_02398 [Baekduia alba]|uniref:hypothetical protein n=1 Tax=Baekduia alba TaxID=2997333 RepID=UPI00233F837E|nr:hypothetical protein [Baekduia alba]WCB93682.1 hypothetical protein DSM104299_02398 [Baekduia alba]
MAPASIAGASQARAMRRGGWDRDTVIIAIQEWVATYGEPPRAADWNPSSAKWSGQQWRVERYRAGRGDGSAWPALNSAKRPFGGSLNAAIRAAGFAPARPGPTRRTSVDPAQADRAMISPEGRAMLEAALAQAREAEKRVAVLEARLARKSKNDKKESKSKHKVKSRVVRERVVDDAAVARAERRAAAAEVRATTAAAQAKEAVGGARMDAAEARASAKRLAAKLERAEATIGTLRDERRELKADVRATAERVRVTERELDAERAEARAARAEADATHALRALAAVPATPAAAAVRAAEAEAAASRHAARTAEARASAAERELRETVAAINGEARRLTAEELARLRADGPSGPAVLATALKSLARARARDGSPTELQSALIAVASAAITWRERI